MGATINSMQTVINNLQDEIKKLNPYDKPVYFNTTEGITGVQAEKSLLLKILHMDCAGVGT